MQKGQIQIILIGILVVVMVAGGAYYLGRSTTSKPSPSPVSPTPQSMPSPTPDETANWQTYTKSIYKYSLRYPPNYSIKEQFNNNSKLASVIISNPNPRPGGGYSQPHIEVVVFENDGTDLQGWLNKHITTLLFDDPSVSREDSQFFYRGVKNQKQTMLGGKNAISFESTLFESSPIPTLTVIDNYIIGFVLNNENETKDPNLKEIYPKILSTFKFLE